MTVTLEIMAGPDRRFVDPFARTDSPHHWEHNAYSVRLTYQGRTMTLPYYMGAGNTDGPTAEGVLECLLSDASSVMYGQTFEEWCGDYGYDGTPAERRTYNACRSQTAKLRRLLGDDLEAAVEGGDLEEAVRTLAGIS